MRQAAYCASKAGMRQALRVLGMEMLDRGVRINFVAPGPTATEMMAALSADHDQADLWKGSPDSLRPPIPDRRVGTPEDVAAAVAFLLSEQSSHIALHDLYVDGGESLGL
jgi:2,3-dihydro-2,3-dihydroxybenzoate dehydrogenase